MDTIEKRARQIRDEHCPAGNYCRDDILFALIVALTPQWQPIETAPKDGTEVDLWHPKLGRITGSNWDTYMERWTILCDPEGPTHYMLPPAPPEVP